MSGTRRKPGDLGEYIQGMKSTLLTLGYTPGTTRNMLKVVGQIGRWLQAEGLSVADLDEVKLERFIADRQKAGFRQIQHRGVFVVLLRLLRSMDVIPARAVISPTAVEALVENYRQWLVAERDLAPTTVLRYHVLARRFLSGDQPGGPLMDLSVLSGRQVSAFILAESRRVSVGSVRGRVGELRSLLRYLYLSGRVASDLSACVPSVANWRDGHLPVSVTPSQVELMVASCDCTRSTGLRDRAILLLLARLGLRSIEVARLQLDDIDWRAGEIEVRGKARRRDRMPLPVDVGEALAGYLQGGRPACSHRSVFVTERAPRKAIPADLVGDVVRRASRRIGCPEVRSHRLRHALATDLLAKGTALVDISQVLRHRDLATTAIYAKVDMLSLRSVAQPWPGHR